MACSATGRLPLNFLDFEPLCTRDAVVDELALQVVHLVQELSLGVFSTKEVHALENLIGLPLDFFQAAAAELARLVR